MTQEWNLDESEEDVEDYRFSNVNPNIVLVLAIGAAIFAVGAIYFAYALVNLAIDGGLIPYPPRLQEYVS